MNDTQRIYHELEMLQELGLIKGDISEITSQKLQEIKDEEQTKELEENQPIKELENHMVKGLEG